MIMYLLSLNLCILFLEWIGLWLLKQSCISCLKSLHSISTFIRDNVLESGLRFFFSYAHIFCCHLLALYIKIKQLCVMTFLHSFSLCFLQYSLWRISRVFSVGIRRFYAKSVQSTDTVRGNTECIKSNICLIPVLISWYRRLISFLISKKEPILFFFYSDLFAYDSPRHSIRYYWHH